MPQKRGREGEVAPFLKEVCKRHWTVAVTAKHGVSWGEEELGGFIFHEKSVLML